MVKRIKNVFGMVLGFALIGAVLTGYGEIRHPRQDAQQDRSVDVSKETGQDTEEKEKADKTEKADETEKAAQILEKYEDNFAVDSKAAEEFARKVKDAATQKDLEALTELAAFPVYVGLPDVGLVETQEDFLKLGAEAVFTDELLESIEKADIKNFQPSMAGFPISDGRIASINFGVADGVLAVNAINY